MSKKAVPLHREIKNLVKCFTYSRLDIFHKLHLFIYYKNYAIMKTISKFKFNDPQETKADNVELLVNKDDIYIVRWKWTTSNRYFEDKFVTYNKAFKRFTERVNFILTIK